MGKPIRVQFAVKKFSGRQRRCWQKKKAEQQCTTWHKNKQVSIWLGSPSVLTSPVPYNSVYSDKKCCFTFHLSWYSTLKSTQVCNLGHNFWASWLFFPSMEALHAVSCSTVCNVHNLELPKWWKQILLLNSAKSEVTLHMVISNSFIDSSNKTYTVLDVGLQNFFTFGEKNMSSVALLRIWEGYFCSSLSLSHDLESPSWEPSLVSFLFFPSV